MNPFDDNYHDDKNPFSSSSSIRNDALSRNPFDSEDGRMAAARTTATSRSLDDDNDDDDIDVVNDIDNYEQEAQNNDTSISAEASWQYLGDLPYRRVLIYTNVRWETSTTAGKTTLTSKDHMTGRTSTTTSTNYDDPTKSVVQQQNHRHNHHQQQQQSYGLASFPTRSLLLTSSSSSNNRTTTNFSNPRILLSKTTMTKCVGCPNGGPIAIVTLPLPSAGGTLSSNRNTITTATNPFHDNHGTTPAVGTTSTVPIRILTVSGKLLSCIDFPPPLSPLKSTTNNDSTATLTTTTSGYRKMYGPTDIFAIGFTNRCILIIIMKDSYCYTYNLRGEVVLSPFYIFSSATTATTAGATTVSAATTNSSNWCELQMVHIYEGGIAAVTTNNDTALVELFDQYDKDLDYISTIHKSARCVVSSSASSTLVTNTSRVASASVATTTNMYGATTTATGLEHHAWIKNQSMDGIPSNYAIITYLPTALYAASHSLDYRAVAVLPRTRTSSRHPEIFLSTNDHSVIVVNVTTLRCTDVNCRARISSPIIDMSFAPNGRFLACYTESSMLTVISTSFETKVLDFDTSEGSKAPPLELKWCGEDSVVLHWKNLGILMVGPYGDWLRFPYEHIDNVFVIPEIDCCRVITDTSVEILQRVPPTTAQLLRIGSIETAAMLLDASDAYHRAGSSSSTVTGSTSNDDSTVRAIIEGGAIDDAIEACIDAARKEFDIYTQKRLLRAASYGMHFSYKTLDTKSLIGGPITGSNGGSNMNEDFGILPTKLTARFVTAARSIRIMNALRHPDVGFVITATQLDSITPTGIIARLVAMKQPALASAISKYLRLPKTVQLYTRACMAAAFIESAPIQMSDADIAERAICIINGNTSADHVTLSNGSVSSSLNSNMNRGAYATVAQTANKVGRPGVANLLLMLESSVADKVPALISTGSYADALAVATTARDADYIFSALLDYERSCLMNATNTNEVAKAQATFLATVVSKFTTEAFHTLRRYLQSSGDMNNLLSLLLKAQRYSDAGIAMGMKATKTDDFREKQGMLAEASRMFGLGKETAFLKTTTDDYIDLLKDQETLRAKYGTIDVAPVTSSVTTAIAAILCYAASSQDQRERMQLLADAEKLARKARMTPKRLYHIRVKAYADAGHWTTLAELAESRQTPIGYKPFIRAAISGYHASNRDDYILSLIQKLGSNEEKFDMLCEAGMWKQALKLAEKDMRDIRRIKQVKDRCTDKAIQIEAGEAISRLSA